MAPRAIAQTEPAGHTSSLAASAAAAPSRFAEFGWLTVRAAAPATVLVDGRPVGGSPVYRFPIAPGRHLVTARCAGCKVSRVRVDVARGQHHEVVLRVDSAPWPNFRQQSSAADGSDFCHAAGTVCLALALPARMCW